VIYKTDYGYKVSVEVVRDTEEGSAHVRVLAPMYMNKEFLLVTSWSEQDFSDSQILGDTQFNKLMTQHFGKIGE
jgi:hypothetical protein